MINTTYVMKDQVRGLVTDIENCDVTQVSRVNETKLHLIAVSVVTFVYLLAAAISG